MSSPFRDEKEIIVRALYLWACYALYLWACYLETGDPTISLESAKSLGMDARPMTEGQEQFSKQLRELAAKTLNGKVIVNG